MKNNDINNDSDLADSASDEIESKILIYKEMLFEAQNEAAKAKRVMNIFLKNINHEIRTPVNGIMGFAQLIKSTCKDESVLTNVEYITQFSNILRNTIDSMIDSALIRSGSITYNPEVFDLRMLIEEILLEKKCQYKNCENIEVHNNIPENLLILNDKIKLFSSFNNIIDNAFRFSCEGSIHISVQENSTEDTLCITIQDTGIGIPAKKQKTILSPFLQVNNGLNREYTGMGLGLYNAKSYVEFLGGALQLESIEKTGTTVRITIHKNKTN